MSEFNPKHPEVCATCTVPNDMADGREACKECYYYTGEPSMAIVNAVVKPGMVRVTGKRRVPREDSFKDWSCETCYWCGRRNNVGYEVPDDIWMAVAGDEDIVLCPACFDKEAQKKGVPYRASNLCFVTWNEGITEPGTEC